MPTGSNPVSGRFPLVVDISGVVVPVAPLATYTTGRTLHWPVTAACGLTGQYLSLSRRRGSRRGAGGQPPGLERGWRRVAQPRHKPAALVRNPATFDSSLLNLLRSSRSSSVKQFTELEIHVPVTADVSTGVKSDADKVGMHASPVSNPEELIRGVEVVRCPDWQLGPPKCWNTRETQKTDCCRTEDEPLLTGPISQRNTG